MLSFCYCIRTRFADVNIFFSSVAASSTTNMQIENVMSRVGALLARIATPASFSLESSTNEFNDQLVAWLTDPSFQLPNGSMVGLCCSSILSLQYQEESLRDDGLTTEFRRFLLAKSLSHSGWRGGKEDVGHADLCGAGHVSGYRLLKRLDHILTPQFLSKCDRGSCQVLFLLVLGTVLGVGYSSPVSEESPTFPPETFHPKFQTSPTLWLAMKEHLCQMLAHHLIFVGSMLGIRLETGLEQRIIDTAVHQWNKAGTFVWGTATGPSQDSRFLTGQQFSPLEKHTKPQVAPLEGQAPPSWGAPLPTAFPRIEPLVPIPCPELAHFQPPAVASWSDNPQSYLEMTDEPEDYSSPSEYATGTVLVGKIAAPRSTSEPVPQRTSMHPWGHEAQRRTMWVVRSFDGGPEQRDIKVHARMRGKRGTHDFAAFL